MNDFAQVLPSNQTQQIEDLLNELEAKTGAQVAVVTLPSLNGEDIDSAREELFKAWGIGHKKKDDGVLVLVAINDRKDGIEVGYGLEPILTDGQTGTIRRQDMEPYFKQGDYGQGLINGSAAIAQIIAQNAGITLTGQIAVQDAGDGPISPILFKLFIFLIFVVFIVIRARLGIWGGYGGGFYGGGWGGGGGGFSGGGGFGGFGGGGSGGGGSSGGW